VWLLPPGAEGWYTDCQMYICFMCIQFARRWAWPTGGLAASRAGLQNFTTTGIFVISGLGLRRGEVRTARLVARAVPVVGSGLIVSGSACGVAPVEDARWQGVGACRSRNRAPQQVALGAWAC